MVSKELYWKDPEKYRKATREYAVAHPEWKRESGREWAAKKRAEDPDFVRRERAANSKYRKANQIECQEKTKAWAHKRPGAYLIYNASQRAKKLGLPFDITRDDIVIPAVCPVLGIPIEATVRGRKGFHPNSPSIDRIIPSLGYVRGNICVISNLANRLKSNQTTPDMLRLVADYIERETARIMADIEKAA